MNIADELKGKLAHAENTVAIAGYVRVSKNNGLEFSTGCGDTWIDIADDAVMSYELLGEAPCGDHVHSFATLRLAAPREGDMSGKLFAKLLSAGVGARARTSGLAGGRPDLDLDLDLDPGSWSTSGFQVGRWDKLLNDILRDATGARGMCMQRYKSCMSTATTPFQQILCKFMHRC